MKENWTITRLAEDLDISRATLQNWYRNGSLEIFRKPGITFPLSFEQKTLLLEQIQQSGRLQQRANRKEKKELSGTSPRVRQWIMTSGLDAEQLIFLCMKSFGEKQVENRELRNLWIRELDRFPGNNSGTCPADVLLALQKKSPADPVGELCMSLQNAGQRIRQGRFFTPDVWIDKLFSRQKINPETRFLDPAMGTGRFLCGFIKAGGKPSRLHGVEKDSQSYRIARMNLLLLTGLDPDKMCLFKEDAFLELSGSKWQGVMDLVMTNPPWGTFRTDSEKKRTLPVLWSKDLFTAFLYLAGNTLKDGGICTYLIPQSLLIQDKYKKIRKEMLLKGSLEWVDLQNAPIKGVQSPPMGISWKKKGESPDFEVFTNQNSYQRSIKEVSNGAWDLFMTPEDKELEARLHRKSGRTLKELNPQWILGIVTGDNKNRLAPQSGVPGTGLVMGKDIQEEGIEPCSVYLQAEWHELQQYARKELYRASCKLIYRFIHPYPLAAIDREGRFLLNSCNGLILEEEKDMLLLCHLLNSRLYRNYYQKKYHCMKILRGHLEELPFPALSDREWDQVMPLMKGNKQNFEEWLRHYFNLEEKEDFTIES